MKCGKCGYDLTGSEEVAAQILDMAINTYEAEDKKKPHLQVMKEAMYPDGYTVICVNCVVEAMEIWTHATYESMREVLEEVRNEHIKVCELIGRVII